MSSGEPGVKRRRDVVLGGLTGIVLAASWTAIMSLVVVAAAVVRLGNERVVVVAPLICSGRRSAGPLSTESAGFRRVRF